MTKRIRLLTIAVTTLLLAGLACQQPPAPAGGAATPGAQPRPTVVENRPPEPSEPAPRDAAADPPPHAGDMRVHPGTGKRMVLVPTTMVRADEASRGAVGGVPVYEDGGRMSGLLRFFGFQERLVAGFWMDATEVTNGEFLRFVRATGSPPPREWGEHGIPRGRDDYPVQVSFEEATSYAAWAGLRLPEYEEFCAAAADEEGAFPWAADVRGAPTGELDVVGSTARDTSPLGIADLAGNALEWGADEITYEGDVFRTAFCFFGIASGDEERTVSYAVRSGDGEARGFRCVDDGVAVACLVEGRPVGRLDLALPDDDTGWFEVRIVSELDVEAELLVSSGHRARCEAGASTDLRLPPGSYMVAAMARGQPGVVSFWRQTIPAEAARLGVKELVWRLSRDEAGVMDETDRVRASGVAPGPETPTHGAGPTAAVP